MDGGGRRDPAKQVTVDDGGGSQSSERAGHDLAEEQAALKRVATLVARGVASDELFVAVSREVASLLGADGARVVRYAGDHVDQPAGWTTLQDRPLPTGRVRRVEASVTGEVFRTGRVVRMEDYSTEVGDVPGEARRVDVRSAVGAPILVAGPVWGAAIAWSMHQGPLHDTAEERLARFAELVAIAVSNSANRSRLERLLAEQEAFRRVATLVAQASAPEAVFAAVAREVGEILGADAAHIGRYEPDGTVLSVAQWGHYAGAPVGNRFRLEGDSVSARVLRTGRPARMDTYTQASGPIGATIRELGIRFGVGVPISLEGRAWGVMIVTSKGAEPFPPETESRLADFAELLDTAIANADSRDQLTASRARVIAAGDEARRRVVRDLHDGAQQRLVHAIVTLKLAQRALARRRRSAAESLVAQALEHAERAMAELRELAHGILPSVLTRGGLRGRRRRARVPARRSRSTSTSRSERLPADIEASAYFIVAEALTNVVKHARATRAPRSGARSATAP